MNINFIMNKKYLYISISLITIATFSIVIYYINSKEITTQEYLENGYEELYNKEEPNYNNAIKYFTKVIKLDPENSDAYYHRGYAKMRLGSSKTKSALSDFKIATKLDSTNSNGFYYAGIIELESKRYDSAIFYFTKCIKFNSEFEDKYRLRAEAYIFNKQYNLAIVDFNSFLSESTFAPYSHHTYFKLGLCYYFIGHHNEAIEAFNNEIYYNPENLFGAIYYWRGISKQMLKDYGSSIYDFTKALELGKYDMFHQSYFDIDWDFKIELAYLSRGISKLQMFDYVSAESDLNKSIEIDKNLSLGYFYLGLSQIQLNEISLACINLSKAGEHGVQSSYVYIKKHCNK